MIKSVRACILYHPVLEMMLTLVQLPPLAPLKLRYISSREDHNLVFMSFVCSEQMSK